MQLRLGSILISGLLVSGLAAADPGSLLAAQQIAVTTPFTSVSDSYYERFGVSFGGRFGAPPANGSGSYGFFNFGGGGSSFQQGSAGSAIPVFGGYDPNSGAQFGFNRVNPNGSGFGFRMELAKGNTRTFSAQAPSLVVQNGFGGSIFDGRITPFVTGVIPVVGNSFQPMEPDNGVTRALASGQLDLGNLGVDRSSSQADSTVSVPPTRSTATIGSASLATIRAEKQAEQAQLAARIASYLEEADKYLAEQEYGLARIRIKRAIALEQDPQRKAELKKKLSEVGR